MSNVKWIKIVTDIFDDEKILLIEAMEDSDSIIVILFKLLCLAGKINNGGVIMLNDHLAYTEDMLATIFRRNLNEVKLAIKTFGNLGMILVINNTITIPNWSKHQSLEALEQRNKYMKDYMRKYRAEQASMINGPSEENIIEVDTPTPNNKPLKEKDSSIYKDIITHLNLKTGKNYKSTTRATKSFIDARTHEGFKRDDFKSVIDNKTLAWKGNPKMEPFLRPNTLFGTKFESYLNEKSNDKKNEDYGW